MCGMQQSMSYNADAAENQYIPVEVDFNVYDDSVDGR